MQKHLIIDFDSTLIEVEGLDELAALALAKRADGAEIAAEIARITDLGMNGKIPIDESLNQRLKLLEARHADVEAIVELLKRKITPSFKANATFFKRNREQIYVISSGFKDYIVPVVAELSIAATHVFANTFIFASDGRITGYDSMNLLAQVGGKSKQLLELGLDGEVYVLGDGYTDFEMTDTGCVTKFIAYTGNVGRPNVVRNADHVVDDFTAFLKLGYFPD